MSERRFRGFKRLTIEQHESLLENGYYTLDDGTRVDRDDDYFYISQDRGSVENLEYQKKLDKVSEPYKLYATDSKGNNVTLPWRYGPTKGTIPIRDDGTGAISVGTPTAETHATNKKYVDDLVASLPSGGGGGTATKLYLHSVKLYTMRGFKYAFSFPSLSSSEVFTNVQGLIQFMEKGLVPILFVLDDDDYLNMYIFGELHYLGTSGGMVTYRGGYTYKGSQQTGATSFEDVKGTYHFEDSLDADSGYVGISSYSVKEISL